MFPPTVKTVGFHNANYMSKKINIKRGDTFWFSIKATLIVNDVQVPQSGLANNFKCMIRDDSETLLGTMVITESDTAGTYIFRCESTSDWPEGTIYFDIQYTDENNIIESTETVDVVVTKDVTY